MVLSTTKQVSSIFLLVAGTSNTHSSDSSTVSRQHTRTTCSMTRDGWMKMRTTRNEQSQGKKTAHEEEYIVVLLSRFRSSNNNGSYLLPKQKKSFSLYELARERRKISLYKSLLRFRCHLLCPLYENGSLL